MNADVLNVIADGDRSLMVVTAGEVSVGDTITKLDETGNGSFPPLAGR